MRRVAMLVASLLCCWFGAPAAFAHADLDTVQFTPAAPGHADKVVLTFSEALSAIGSTVVVLDPNGESVETGQATTQGATISVDLQPIRVTGTYRVNFRVVAADGHVATGSRTVRLSTSEIAATSGIYPGQTASPETSAVTSDDPQFAFWVTGFIMLAALMGAVAVWRLRRLSAND